MFLQGNKKGRAALVCFCSSCTFLEQSLRAECGSRSQGTWPGTWETQFLGWVWPHQEGVPGNL